MERLTKAHYKESDGHYLVCSEMCKREDCTAECGHFDEAIERLAAYEDTGLSPQACIEAREIEAGLSSEDYSIHRMVELMRADKDGRLVVLPCKVGEGLWTFCSHPVEQVYSFTVTDISTLNGRTMLNTSRCGVIDARDVGKTVFLTREEAQKALEGRR